MSVPTNLIPTKITGLPEYQGTSVDGYLPYVIDGRTYKVRFGNIAAVGAVPSTRRVATGTGLAGGGDLSEDRTIYIPNGGVGDDQLSATGVTGGTYGSSTQIPIITVDFKGRLTSASSVALEVPVLDLSDPSKTQGALPLGRGGTGSVISPAPGAIPYSTASSLALTSVGLAGQVLMSGGTGAPYWETVTGTGTVTSVDASGGTTGLTFTGGPVTTVGTLTLGGTLAITHGGTGATDAATARVNIGAAASGANSDITSMSGITGAIGTPDYIDFDTAATVTRATGRLWWDNADGNQTLSLGMAGSNATLQVGQEMYFRIKATAPITEGQGVMFTGTVGASGALTGGPASGLTKDTASYFMGVATEDIPLNSWGYVTQFGLVRGINTTGGAEAWVDGQILYYNPAVAGGFTKTVPAAPAAKIEVAAVVHAAPNGSIFVRPISRFSLGQLNDLETSAASDLDLLQYNGPAGYWQHKSPSLISVGSATNLAGGAANRIAYQTGAGATGFIVAPTIANTYLEWSGSGFQWSANPLGTVTSVNASGGTTGLTFTGGPVTTAGTLTLGGTLAVASGGTGATTAPNARTNLGATTIGSNLFTLTNPSAVTFPRFNADNTVSTLDAATFRTAIGAGTGNGSVTSVDGSGGTTGLTLTGGPITGSGTLTLGGTLAVANGGTGATTAPNARTNLGATTVGSSFFTLTNPSAITFPRINADNTVSALSAADFRAAIGVGTGTGTVTSVDVSGGTTGLTFSGGPVTSSGTITMAGTLGVANGGTGATSFTSGYLLKGNGTSAVSASVVYDNGTNVGIGTSSPLAKLDLGSAVGQKLLTYGNGNIRYGLSVETSEWRAFAAQAAVLTFGHMSTSDGTTFTERMRITSAGFVGIGTNNPSSKLTVLDGDIEVNATGLGNTLLSFNGTTANLTVNSSSAPLVFGTNSTERMRITSNGNMTVGSTGSFARLASVAADGTYQLALVGTSKAVRMRSDTTNFKIEAVDQTLSSSYEPLWLGGSLIQFGTSTTERMRIDSSGNVLVGTTTAGSAGFTVNQSSNISFNEAAGQSLATIFRQASSGDTVIGSGVARSSNANAFASSYSSAWARSAVNVGYGTIKFYTAAEATVAVGTDTTMNERMRIDIFGNVGVGVTPSASDLPTIQSTYGIISGNAQINIAQNAYYSGGWKYTGTAAATLYFQGSGAHNWQIAASGTAGAAISFTQAMTLNASGNLGIGTTSPSQRLDATVSSGTEGVGLGVTNSLAGGYGSGINFYSFRTDGTTKLTAGAIQMYGQANWADATNTSSSMRFYTVGNNTLGERMRITASGDVGIGTTSPGAKFAVSNGGAGGVEILTNGVIQSYNRATSAYQTMYLDAQSILFRPSGSEAARIDASGNLLVGGSTVFGKVSVQGNTNADLDVWIRNDNAGSASRAGIVLNASGNSWRMGMGSSANNSNALTWNVDIGGANTERMRIDTSGNVGIATSSPAGLLHVAGTSAFSWAGGGTTTATAVVGVQGTSGGSFFVNTPSLNSSFASGLAIDGSYTNPGGVGTSVINLKAVGVNSGGGYDAVMAFHTATGSTLSEKMRILANGNVGIGTTSPSLKFVVSNGGAAGLEIDPTALASSPIIQSFNRSGAAYTQLGFNALQYVWQTSGTERARIDTGGNLLVGTTGALNTTSKLRVYQVSGDKVLELYANTTTCQLSLADNGNIAAIRHAGGLNLMYNNAGTLTDGLRLTHSGDVGIGITGPGARLHVAATNPTRGILYLVRNDGSSGLTGSQIQISQNTIADWAFGQPAGVSAFAFWSNRNTSADGTEVFRLSDTGVVTSPNLADAVGYKGLPQNSQTTGYTLALSDMGKHISITTGNITIPANGSVAFPVGAAVTIFNNSGSTQTISITTDTLRQAGTTNTGTRTLAAYGVATVLKVASTTWVISGNVT